MSHESEQEKFENVVSKLAMSQDQRRKFHEFLNKHYSLEKDNMSYEQLLSTARDFLRNYY